MRETIGSSWIFMLVIAFTLIFSGFLVLTLSYSKTYKMKNEITSIIEKYEGLTDNSQEIINDYLNNSSYRTKGKCVRSEVDIQIFGADSLTGSLEEVGTANGDKLFYYCISYRKNHLGRTVFKVTLFYDFNLPIFGQLTRFEVKGETYSISNAFLYGKPLN